MLLIDSDFDDVILCSTYEDLMHVARIMISSRADILTMDAAYNDVCNYRSAVGHFNAWRPMDTLYEAGLDPFGILVQEFKDAGIITLAGYRVNDHHGAPYYWTPWERAHKEWSLGKETGVWRQHKAIGDRGWRELGDLRQMDYTIEGVRARRLALLQEIVTKYDVDGIQLDFGRTAPFLSEPKREKAHLLTQFVRDARKMLDMARAGDRPRLVLAAILPWDLDFCEREGLEVGRWIEEELVSYVSPGEWFYADWNIPLVGWVELTSGTKCKLYPMTCTNVFPTTAVSLGKRVHLGDDYPVFDGPKIRSLAETFYSQGAEGMMLYNFYARVSEFERYYPFVRDWTDPAKIPSMTKHYYYARRLKYLPTEHYSFGLPDGYAPDEVEAFTPFPLMEAGDEIKYPFLFGSELSRSTGTFRFKLKNMMESDQVRVMLNESSITADSMVSRDRRPEGVPALQSAIFEAEHPKEAYKVNAQMNESAMTVDYAASRDEPPEGAPAFRFTVWEAEVSMPPLQRGANNVRIRLTTHDPLRAEPIEAGEFEILVTPAGNP